MKQLLTYQLFVNWRCEGNFAAAMWLFSNEIRLFTSRARTFKYILTVTIIEIMDRSVSALLEADIQVHIQIALIPYSPTSCIPCLDLVIFPVLISSFVLS